ncbi:N-acetylglucosamine-6-phosphate deacetylase [Kineococcus sp. SYSU DK006]|uniref:N-acetylglucosamine-6-phosphate deacetylase n=1 Tax=Kineococcus sp. SYSU DK006 TaxID=3383127 RepID=UPI003D7CDA0F
MVDLLFVGAHLLGSSRVPAGTGWLSTEGGAIAALGAGAPPPAAAGGRQVVDVSGYTLMPGFIDVHVHGALGHEAMDGNVPGLLTMASFFASHGVTSFLPTTWTADRAETLRALEAIAEAVDTSTGAGAAGARVLGAHMEGPYLSDVRCGAQDPHQVRGVDREEAAAFLDTGAVRLITVAPESEGAGDLIDECVRRGVAVSIGHTDATYEQVDAALARGASHMTHAFNAMSPFSARVPGAVGAALALPGFDAEVIADDVHVHPGAVRALVRARGLQEVVLVTDAIRPTGSTGEQELTMAGRPVAVRDGAVRFPSGQLVGSVLTMDAALGNVRRATGLPLEELWPIVSANPARSAGVARSKGRLEVGMDADLVVVDDRHDGVRVVMTVVGGRIVPTAPGGAGGS